MSTVTRTPCTTSAALKLAHVSLQSAEPVGSDPVREHQHVRHDAPESNLGVTGLDPRSVADRWVHGAGVKVGMITEQPEYNGSTYYRAVQYLPRLRARGVSVELLAPKALTHPQPGAVGQARYFGRHALRYARRAHELTHALRSFDAVFIQRGVYPWGLG